MYIFNSFYLLHSYNPSFLICLCFNMVSFRGQKKLATPRSVSFRGLIQTFWRASPPIPYAESPPPRESLSTYWNKKRDSLFSKWCQIKRDLNRNFRGDVKKLSETICARYLALSKFISSDISFIWCREVFSYRSIPWVDPVLICQASDQYQRPVDPKHLSALIPGECKQFI